MGLSKRERMIVLATVVVVGLFVADRFVRANIASYVGGLQSQRQKSQTAVQKAKLLLAQSAQEQKKHQAFFAKGLWSDAEAESQVARALNEWSADAGLVLPSIKPERMAGDKGMKEMIFVITGKGRLDAVSWFLYQVETSELPLKIKYMQLGSSSEAGDSMSLELRLSTLYLAADEKTSAPTRGAAGRQRQSKQRETKNEEQI